MAINLTEQNDNRNFFESAQPLDIHGLGGDDTIFGGTVSDTIDGGVGNDLLQGYAGADSLIGDDGDDTLAGENGEDTLIGGLGADSLDGGAGNDRLVENTADGAPDTLNGGDDDDVYVIHDSKLAIVDSSGVDRVEIDTSFFMSIFAPTVENLTVIGAGDSSIYGNDLANFIIGNVGDDSLSGGAGVDTLFGMDGDDYLSGDGLSTGRDSLYGGKDDDTYGLFDLGLNANLFENPGEGIDTVVTSARSFTLNGLANIENLELRSFSTSPVPYTGTGNALNNFIKAGEGQDILSGLTGDDTLQGGDGADTLQGDEGVDSLIGGEGDDYYALGVSTPVTVIDDEGHVKKVYVLDTVVESSDAGIDSVVIRPDGFIVGYVLPDNIEGFGVYDGSDFFVIGNALNDGMTGNNQNNRIEGADGADTLVGLAGLDTLNGGVGNDSLSGGADYDTLTGGLGDDIYVLDGVSSVDDGLGHVALLFDVASEAAGEGTDTAEVSADAGLESYSIDTNLENVKVTGAGGFTVGGNELANLITGNAAGNAFDGGVGNDTLNGGGGLDTLAGGDDGDVYDLFDVTSVMQDGVNHSAYDTIVEAAGSEGGVDTVFVTQAGGLTVYRLPDPVENGVVLGKSRFDLYGNAGRNQLTGSDGANFLYAEGGADTLNGGEDLDTLTGGDGGDTYILADKNGPYDVVDDRGAGGRDTVIIMGEQRGNVYTLGADIENGEMAAGNGRLIGNAGGNRLSGLAENQQIEGRGGADTVEGGDGYDTLLGGSGDDLYLLSSVFFAFDENGNLGNHYDFAGEKKDGGLDTARVTAAVLVAGERGSYALTADVERGEITGALDFDITGNALENALTGNRADNRLDGGAGVDTMRGGKGDDVYIVDSRFDDAIEKTGAGDDRVVTSVNYALADRQHIETLAVSQDASGKAIRLTGNGFANTLIGGGGANVLDGGGGADQLTGRGGEDTFKFSTDFGPKSQDRIMDFSVRDDTIALDRHIFAGLAKGDLAKSAFHVGNGAADVSDRVIYDRDHFAKSGPGAGALLYDPDGKGGAAAEVFARIDGDLKLTEHDFNVI